MAEADDFVGGDRYSAHPGAISALRPMPTWAGLARARGERSGAGAAAGNGPHGGDPARARARLGWEPEIGSGRWCMAWWMRSWRGCARRPPETAARNLVTGRIFASMKKALVDGITGRTAPIWPSCCSPRATRCTASSAAPPLLNTDRIDHLYQIRTSSGGNLFLHYGDLTDSSALTRVIQTVQPDEIYNLGAMSHVAVSFEVPEYTANADALGPAHPRGDPPARAGAQPASTRRPARALRPGSGSAAARDHAVLPAQPLCRRQALCLLDHGELPRAYGMYACTASCQHESPVRGETF